MTVTTAISSSKATNLLEGAIFADTIGKPLNQLITIHWSKADGNESISSRFGRLRVCAQKWLGRRGAPLTCCWVFEAPKQDVHCHIAIHLPPHLVKGFTAMLPIWIGGNDVPGMIDVRPITTNGWRKYFLKGVGPDGWNKFNIPHRHRLSQGKIKGKRCGTSENIGPSARKIWNNRITSYFHEQRTV